MSTGINATTPTCGLVPVLYVTSECHEIFVPDVVAGGLVSHDAREDERRFGSHTHSIQNSYLESLGDSIAMTIFHCHAVNVRP